MGLTSREFWDLHPSEFAALFLRCLNAAMPMATLNSHYVNAHLPEGAERSKPTDYLFMLKQHQGEQSPEVAAMFEQIALDKMAARFKSMEKV